MCSACLCILSASASVQPSLSNYLNYTAITYLQRYCFVRPAAFPLFHGCPRQYLSERRNLNISICNIYNVYNSHLTCLRDLVWQHKLTSYTCTLQTTCTHPMHNAYNKQYIPMIIYCSLPKHHRTFPVTIPCTFCKVHAQFLSGTVYLYVCNDIHLHCGQQVSFTTIISPPV